MKKAAVLLDGSFVQKVLQRQLRKPPTAEETVHFAKACVEGSEELFRIYYYDCPPFGLTRTKPISNEEVDFAATPLFNQQTAFQNKLSCMDHIAFRKGMLSFKGWKIGPYAIKHLMKNPRQVQAQDLVPDLKQKRVDMKIGLDIAWLSSKSIVERIILVTGDADFIPAMKFARREGVQVVLVTLGNPIKEEMKHHVDIFRTVNWQP
ncbi:MAG: NYN domain-containing protein [Proteobacteria bacterium]|nr:NYN domain-containing protein [Pseudomonadota bacterium]